MTVLYCHWVPWADEADKKILANARWKAIIVAGSPKKNTFSFYLSKVWFKVYRGLNRRGFQKALVAEQAQARGFSALLKTAKSISADYYIGHNLAALAVAVLAAEANKSGAGFDFEDYHRGEVKNMPGFDLQRIIYLEKKYLHRCSYLSFASPLIRKRTMEHFPGYTGKMEVIFNAFPLIPKNSQNTYPGKRLQLFWFSQTVGADRGLITALVALKLLNDPGIRLVLVGSASPDIRRDFYSIISSSRVQLEFAGVVSPHEIDEIAAASDVGLALEIDEPENRNLCLTNKIFTYLAAGNAIIFSDTAAQKAFCIEHEAGQVYKIADAAALAECIRFYQNEKDLAVQKDHNRQLAEKKFNWEDESTKLLELVNSTFATT